MKINQYTWDPDTDLIATGAFAEVFRATDVNSSRKVALKIYKESVAKGTTSASSGQRKYTLEQEFGTLNGLSHTNLISYYGLEYLKGEDTYGRPASYPVIIMELGTLGTLTDFMKTNPAPEVVEKLLRDIMAGVSYLHEEGILHRDLKPSNVLVTQNRKGQPIAKITDFGISKDLLKEDALDHSFTEGVGTPHYMAPEQFYKKRFGVDGNLSLQTDLWAIGVMAYLLMTGKKPFGQGTRDFELIREQIVTSNPSLEALTQKGRALVQHSLLKKAVHRPDSVDGLLEAFDKGEVSETLNTLWQTQETESEEATVHATSSEPKPKHATPVKQPEAGEPSEKARKQAKLASWLVPIIVLLVLISVVVISSRQEKIKKFNALVIEADELIAQSNYKDALVKYEEAGEIRTTADFKEKLKLARANNNLVTEAGKGSSMGIRNALNDGARVSDKYGVVASAIKKGCLECVKILAQNGAPMKSVRAKVTKKSNALSSGFRRSTLSNPYLSNNRFKSSLFASYTPGNTLALAASLGHTEIVKYLLENHYGDVDSRANLAELTPMMYAVKGNHVLTARLLLEKKANVYMTESRSYKAAWDFATTPNMKNLLKGYGGDNFALFGFSRFEADKSSNREFIIEGNNMTFKSFEEGFGYKKTDSINFSIGNVYEHSVKIQKKSGSDSGGYGLVFSGKDDKNYNAFLVTSSGSFVVSQMVDGKWENFGSWSLSTGWYDKIPNTLTIKKSILSYSFYINGKLEKTVYYNKLKNIGPHFGVFLNGNIKEAVLSDFKITGKRL